MSAPSSLSLENVVANQGDGHLFSGTGTYHVVNGYFGGNTNISRTPSDGQWGLTVALTVGLADVTLTDIVVNLHHTGNGGTNPNKAGQAKTAIAITITDTSGPSTLDSVSESGLTDTTGLGEDVVFSMTSPLTLEAGGVYDVTFLVDSPETWGHYAVFDALTFNGEVTVIPEPASLAMGLAGLTLIAVRRRR
jgi:hypothetical protein